MRPQFALALFAALACGSEPTKPPTKTGPVRIVMSIEPDTILLGRFAGVTAYGEDAAGSRWGETPILTSLDTTIATVDSKGIVTPHRVGSVSIKASLGTLSSQVSLRVGPSIQLNPQLPSLFAGDTLTVIAKVTDGPGSTSSVPATFISRNPAIASVSTGGIVTGTAAGTVTIVAKADVAADSVLVAVLPIPLGVNGSIVAACATPSRLCRYGATTDTLPVPSLVGYALNGYAASPDGRRLAVTFSAQGALPGQLWVTDRDGISADLISSNFIEGWPQWSPDATQIAVEGAKENHVVIAYLDHTPDYKLGGGTADQANQPAFSPDGRRVAFVRGGSVWVLRLSGAEAPNELHVPGTAIGFSWSPDGRWIAVATRGFVGEDIAWWGGVWLVRPDDTGLRAFSPNCGPALSCSNASSFEAPAWSPDAKSIVVWRTTFNGVNQPTLPWSYEARSVATGAVAGSFTHPALTFPAWSPDGQRIVWTGQDADGLTTSLFSSRVDGSDVRRLAGGVTGRPIWVRQP